jgi:hypothetical protein
MRRIQTSFLRGYQRNSNFQTVTKPEGRVFKNRLNECIVFFNLRDMILRGFNQPLTEMSISSRKIMFLGSRKRPVSMADNLTAFCEPIV